MVHVLVQSWFSWVWHHVVWFNIGSARVFSCGSGWSELSVRSSAMAQLSNLWLHIDRTSRKFGSVVVHKLMVA